MRHRHTAPRSSRDTSLGRLSQGLQRRSVFLLAAAVALAMMAGAALFVPQKAAGIVPTSPVDAAAVQALTRGDDRAQRSERQAIDCSRQLPRPTLILVGHRVRTMIAQQFAAYALCGTAGSAPGTAESPTSQASTPTTTGATEEAPAPVSTQSSSPAPTPVPAAQPAPANGDTAWGSSVMAYGTETYAQAFARTTQQLQPEVIRFFNPGTGGPSWPTRTGDTPLVISFKLPPREVLSGRHDAQLAAFFAATPRLTYWTYWHEPEDDRERGAFSPADYRAAWAHIDAIADASGKPLRATLILMGYTAKTSSHRNWADYYAGPQVIDVLAWDAYAWGPRDTPESVYGAARSVSQQAGKPWAIAETGVGSQQFRPAERQAMLTAMARYLATSTPQPEFVTYFDSDPDAPNMEHGWNISREPTAAAAWLAGQTG